MKKYAFSFVRNILSVIVLSLFTVFNAQANLLTAGDFEGISTLDGYWASSAGIWGAENAVLTGATNGITPFDGQMLQINHAGGGSVSQAHQIVAGSFTAGSTVSFDVQLNAFSAGKVAQLFFGGRNSIGTADVDLVFSSILTLDSDSSTWETLSVTGVLASDFDFLSAEIRFFHNTSLAGGAGYADNAVLTATSLPVPAPETIWILAPAMFSLVGFARRKKRN